MKIHWLSHCHLIKSFDDTYFPELWKNSNIIYHSTQKNEKQNFENYHSVSLLPIFSKEFEKKYLIKCTSSFKTNNLNQNQSGFRHQIHV